MTKAASIATQPQAKVSGKGWVNCQSHQATRWAVTRNGKVLSAFPTKTEAETACASALRANQRKKDRGPKPSAGSRYSDVKSRVAGNGAPIAASLSKEHHDKLKAIAE